MYRIASYANKFVVEKKTKKKTVKVATLVKFFNVEKT